MARVVAFELEGIEMWIPSGDHDPPHFHARKPGHWDIKVHFLEDSEEAMIQRIRPPDARIRGRERRALIEAVREHRAALLAQWDECQAQE